MFWKTLIMIGVLYIYKCSGTSWMARVDREQHNYGWTNWVYRKWMRTWEEYMEHHIEVEREYILYFSYLNYYNTHYQYKCAVAIIWGYGIL